MATRAASKRVRGRCLNVKRDGSFGGSDIDLIVPTLCLQTTACQGGADDGQRSTSILLRTAARRQCAGLVRRRVARDSTVTRVRISSYHL